MIAALHCVACLLSSRGYAKSCRPQRGHRSTRFLGALHFPLGLAAAGGRLPTDAVLGALVLQLSRGLGLFWWAVGLLCDVKSGRTPPSRCGPLWGLGEDQ